jgi:hypothetical protein
MLTLCERTCVVHGSLHGRRAYAVVGAGQVHTAHECHRGVDSVCADRARQRARTIGVTAQHHNTYVLQRRTSDMALSYDAHTAHVAMLAANRG